MSSEWLREHRVPNSLVYLELLAIRGSLAGKSRVVIQEVGSDNATIIATDTRSSYVSEEGSQPVVNFHNEGSAVRCYDDLSFRVLVFDHNGDDDPEDMDLEPFLSEIYSARGAKDSVLEMKIENCQVLVAVSFMAEAEKNVTSRGCIPQRHSRFSERNNEEGHYGRSGKEQHTRANFTSNHASGNSIQQLGHFYHGDVHNNYTEIQNAKSYFHTLPQPKRNQLLLDCVGKRQLRRLDLVIQAAANPDYKDPRDEHGNTALHIAAKMNSPEIAEVLLGHGADIDILNDIYWTPLMVACQAGHDEFVQFLISQHASLEGGRTAQENPLSLATLNKRESIAIRLIDAGAPVDAAVSGFVRLPDMSYHLDLWNSFHDAAISGCYDVLKRLFVNPDPSYLTHERTQDRLDTALHICARFDHVSCVEVLEKRTLLETKNICGDTALATAVHSHSVHGRHDLTMLGVLLSSGADVHTRNTEGLPLLARALRRGRRDVARLLLSYGAQMEALVSIDGQEQVTLVRWAIEVSPVIGLDCFNWLVEHGAQTNWPNSETEDLLSVAFRKKNYAAMRVLLENKAPFSTPKLKDNQLILQAIRARDHAATTLLLLAGAQIPIWDDSLEKELLSTKMIEDQMSELVKALGYKMNSTKMTEDQTSEVVKAATGGRPRRIVRTTGN